VDKFLEKESIDEVSTSCRQCEPGSCGCVVPIVPDPWVGKVLDDKYEILSLIDSGGMSHVYRARHKTLKVIRAVKVMRTESLSHRSLKRLEKEAVTVSSLVHQNLVSCVDFGVTVDGSPYVVMEYIEGRTLARVIESGETFEPERLIDVTVQVCDGLHYAHQAYVFHRDIKPGNIIILNAPNGTEHVKILDFGIAKIQEEVNADSQRLTRTGEICGSPFYMSPEQGRGLAIDERADVYSLGCVMFEMLTGQPPFMGNNPIETIMMHINSIPKLGSMPNGKKVPSSLEAVIMRCLEKDVDRRYRTVGELQKDLELIKKGDSLVSLKVGQALSQEKWRIIRRTIIGISMFGWASFSVYNYGFADSWSRYLSKADSMYYDMDSAEKYLHMALDAVPKDDQKFRNRASVFMSWGRLYGTRNSIEQSREYFLRSKDSIEDYARESKGKGASTYLPLLADAYQGLATCDLASGSLRQAENEALEAVRVRKSSLEVSWVNHMLDERLLARAYNLLGQVQMKLEEYAPALTSFEEARKIEARYEQEQLHLSSTMEKMGDAYVAQKKNEQALELYQKCLSIRNSVFKHNPDHASITELGKKIRSLEEN
jgi:serine/threonine protein kinase